MASSSQLAIEVEAHSRQRGQHRDCRRKTASKLSGAPRFIMILEKSRQPVAEHRIRLEMAPDVSGARSMQPIKQTFVVGEIESLLLQRPLEVPIHLGEV